MAKLTDEQQTHIVHGLACFDTLAQVQESLREEFGVAITPQQVQKYDPTRASGRHLSKKLRAIFEATRKTFLEETATIPIAKQTFRLRNLQRLYEQARQRRNVPLAAALLEQAAKETGGMFTNRREHSGPAGGPIPVAGKVEHLHTLSDADLERIAAGAIVGPGSGGA